MTKEKKKEHSTNLFSEFNPVTREIWENLINNDLRTSDYKQKLQWDTDEGVSMLPFYMQEDLKNLPHLDTPPDKKSITGERLGQNDWRITESITSSSIEESNRLAREAVEMGADTLLLSMEAAPNEGMLGGDLRGIPLQEQKDMRDLLNGLDLKAVTICFDCGIVTPLLLCMFMNEIERQNLTPADINASFYYDPFTWGAAHGRWPNKDEKTSHIISQLCNSAFPALGINGTFYNNCGATIVQELGTALAIGSEFLAHAGRNDVPVSKTARSIHMRLSAGPLYFPEIAKFRAARMLWTKMVSAYDPAAADNAKLIIHAETSSWNKAITDPHTNILRTTTEAMSAVAGGADSVRIDPFDNRSRQASPIARRIARNIHHILRHEANLNKVSDPSGGAYYVEQLTDKIASESWEFFRFLEKQGGFTKAIEGRFLQLAIGESIRKKQSAFKEGTKVLTGVNRYPNPDERIPDELFQNIPVNSLKHTVKASIEEGTLSKIRKLFRDEATIGDTIDGIFKAQKQLYTSLEQWQAAEPFETLRISTLEYKKKNGRVPVVAILSAGNNKKSKFRAAFSNAIFGIPGYKTCNYTGYDSFDAAEDEITSLKPDIIVLCGSDADYAKLAEPFCRTFRKEKNNKPLLVMAGQPEGDSKKFRETGIDYFIYSWSGDV